MKVINNNGKTVLLKHVCPGEMFQFVGRDEYFMMVDEPMDECSTYKIINLETGKLCSGVDNANVKLYQDAKVVIGDEQNE